MSVKTVSAGLWSVIMCALILVGGTGCKDDTIYKVVEPGSISPGDAVPAPTNDVVLIVSGKVSAYKHRPQMTNPKFIIADEKTVDAFEYFSGGIYPAASNLSSRQIKYIIRPVL